MAREHSKAIKLSASSSRLPSESGTQYSLAALIALFMAALHPGIVAVATVFGPDWTLRGVIGDVAVGSIYIPLLLPESIGLTTLRDTPALFSPPNMLGWMFIFSTWYAVYLLIAAVAVHVWGVLTR